MWEHDESVNVAAAADTLLAEVAADDWGQVAVSLYDTGRLIALAPWLAGHQARLDFLCRRQNADGGWGEPDGYAVVPTLSATSALLAELRRDVDRHDRRRLVRAAAGGLGALRRWLDPDAGLVIPDTIAVELIVPALVQELYAQMADVNGASSVSDLSAEALRSLRLPTSVHLRPLSAMRSRFADGTLPPQSWACLEVFGAAAAGAPFVRPSGGAVGCSAAATAAWVGGPDGDASAVEFLDTLQRRGGGPVPGVTPITYFEPAWVFNSLAAAGLTPAVPAQLLDRLEFGLTAAGAPAAPGLPPDADDTAAVLSALMRNGRIHRPDSLLDFQSGEHFVCFPGERTPSVSTNAHVLETFALYLRDRPAESARYAGAAETAARWLRARQHADGSWLDKWHASAYYATACCVLALDIHAGAQGAIERAVAWVLDTQRDDGSWGRWHGTVEETAYAVQILATGEPDHAALTAIKSGCAYLLDAPPLSDHPPLWHAKDLYAPVAVIAAARLAALHLGVQAQAGTAARRPDPQARR